MAENKLNQAQEIDKLSELSCKLYMITAAVEQFQNDMVPDALRGVILSLYEVSDEVKKLSTEKLALEKKRDAA